MNASRSSGVGFLFLLTFLFIALKLAGHIDWSWVWIVSPLWLPLAAFGAVSLFVIVFMALIAFVSFKMARWRHRR